MFNHLHVHTEFSLLDGLPQIKNLVAKAKEHGMKNLAITDHGVLYGAHKFYQACKKEEVKPIIGCEVYIAPRKHTQKVAKLDESPHHLVLLAENEQGYKNLIKLVSLSHIDGFYYKPRIDLDLLASHKEGLVGLSACLAGEISRKAVNGTVKEAEEIAKRYAEIFAKDHFYIELQRNGIAEQEPANKALLEIAKDLSLPIIATCDVHYINKTDALAQEVLMCISTGKRLEDTNRLTRQSDEFYLKSDEEMKELFKDLPEAIENTEKVADMCNVNLDMKDWTLAIPSLPELYHGDFDKYLYDLTMERGKKRLGRELNEDEKKRAEYEFNVIKDKGFTKYMLMVMEFTDWIHENHVPHTTRGSAAGSLLAYFIGIVNANPLKFNLAFERFLNPLRPKAPDIDLDVASTRREEMIEYAMEKYGASNVAQIVTFGRMQARGSIRDAGRVQGLPLAYVDKIAKLIPPSGQGLAKVDINKAIKEVPEFAELIKQDPDAAKLVDTAKRIEGVAKSQGIHACGILITPGPIIDYVPVIWDKTLGQGGRMITQYEMDSLEELGLIKMDFLGLTNLDTIAETVKIVKREKEIDVDLANLPLDDEPTYKLMRDLDTEGVFQFETDPMKGTIKILQPTNIFDVSAALALVRPGPNQYQQEYADRKAGRKKTTYLDPRMKEFLNLSYGVLVYQEDILRAGINLGGMDWGEVDKLRKATGKKKPDVLFEMHDELIERFVKNGMEKERAEALFQLFVPFTNYAFNQAHAAAYSLIVYQSAYLKTHYPVEFMAGLLKSEINDFEKVSKVMSECAHKQIKILPPDINMSKTDFSIEDKTNIRFGLAAIKNLGKSAVDIIIAAREKEDRPFTNFDDFLYRIPLGKVNQKAIQYLIEVGAFDNFGERNSLIAALPSLFDKYRKMQTAETEGQLDIFSLGQEGEQKVRKIEPTPLPHIDPATDSQKIEWEKELLGMFLTSHPLGKIANYLNSIGVRPLTEVKTMKANTHVQVCGLVTNVKRITTKKDAKSMAFLTLEDQSGTIELVMFPKTFAKFGDKLVENAPIIFIGKVNIREGDRTIVVDSLKLVDLETAGKLSDGLLLRIPTNASKESLALLKKVLQDNPGNTMITIQIPKEGVITTMHLKNGIQLTDEVNEVISPFRVN